MQVCPGMKIDIESMLNNDNRNCNYAKYENRNCNYA